MVDGKHSSIAFQCKECMNNNCKVVYTDYQDPRVGLGLPTASELGCMFQDTEVDAKWMEVHNEKAS